MKPATPPETTTFREQRLTLQTRLKEAGLNLNRFHGLRSKTKIAWGNFLETNSTVYDLDEYPSIGVNVGNGLVVLDVDQDGYEELNEVFGETFTVKSGGKGKPHFYYKIDENTKFDLATMCLTFGEVKCDRGYVVACGSHIDYVDEKKGRVVGDYTILKDLPIRKISTKDFFNKLKPYEKPEKNRLTPEKIERGVNEGERHNTAISYANRLALELNLDYNATVIELEKWNQKNTPPLPKAEIERCVKDAIKWQKQHPKERAQTFQKTRVIAQINPVLLAKDIMEDYTFLVEEQSRTLFVYEPETGCYTFLAEEKIKREIVKRLDENSRQKFFHDVEFYIRNTAPIKKFCEIPELLLTKDCVLNLKSREYFAFSPEYFIVNKIPVKYDPEAKINAIEKFFKSVELTKDEIFSFQEFLGYCLYKGISFHKALMLVGEGRNGKGVTLNLISAFLGKENISTETLQNICYNRFSTANLYCKLANISADLPSNLIKYTGIFKMVIGGDLVSHEKKCETARPFNPYAKHLYSANHIPPISNTEDCDAYYARWLIIEYKKQFLGKNADKHLLEKLTTDEELSGLLNWALDGLKRLYKNKDFTMKENIADMRKQYIKRSNSAKAFIEEDIEVTSNFNDFIPSKYMYTKFLTYCSKNKVKSQSQREFIENMKEHCLGADFRQTRLSEEEQKYFGEDKDRTNAWHYVKLVSYVSPVSPIDNSPEKKLDSFGKSKTLDRTDKTDKITCFDCGKELGHERYPNDKRTRWYCRGCNQKRMEGDQ